MRRVVNELGWVPAGIDVNRANPARVHDYLLGGRHNFPADRWAAERAADDMPDLAAVVRARRMFLHRAVRFLVSADVRQFIDLGSGMPTEGHVHEIAQQLKPATRVVYVDVDPVAVAHGRALLAGIDGVSMVHADLRDVPLVLAAPALRDTIDLSRPVAVLMIAVLNLLPDADDPAGIVARYRDAVPGGSHLALSHPTFPDVPAHPPATAVTGGPTGGHDGAETEGRRRTRDDIAAFFAGWDLMQPGLVEIELWHPELGRQAAGRGVTELGGLARKA
jgi:O-methyltransferase involved in polyketide biosynthesis